ncbi:TolC family protein [Rugamonas apoptosis]|uniref:TolC family protein n=1 Tax=Rugamonas apoptosis TaxID=2758570 RepID=A0A7W2IM00_9BURK|nr:TolC family protein [Rugamonas apoptosis]MBA5689193.1 TolC family protein [Rugamonas apoptosis]
MCNRSIASETLAQAWASAQQVDHTVAAASARESAARDGLAAAEARRLPNVSLTAGYTRLQSEPTAAITIPALHLNGLPFAQDEAYSAAVSFSAPLFTAGRISHGIAAAGAVTDAARAASALSKQELKLAVAEAYVTVLRAQRLNGVAATHVTAIARHADDVEQLYKQGYAAKHDVLASQVALADARQQALQAANGVALASAAYNRLLGRAQDAPADLAELNDGEEPSASQLAGLIAAGRAQRNELSQLGAQETALRRQSDSVAAQRAPQVGLNGGWGKLQNRYLVEDKGWWIGVALKWELFDGGQIKRESSQLASNARAVAELRADAADKIELQVRQAWLRWQEAAARIDVARAALAQADETLDLSRERYRAGLAPNSEVLDAETRRAGAYANRDNAWYDRALARLRLQYASGSL